MFQQTYNSKGFISLYQKKKEKKQNRAKGRVGGEDAGSFKKYQR